MSKSAIPEMRATLRALFLSHGFEPRRYDPESDPGEYLTKVLVADKMMNFKVDGIDNELIYPDTRIMVEVMPTECVQLIAQGVDYYEEGVSVFSDRGLQLLADAGVDLAALNAIQASS